MDSEMHEHSMLPSGMIRGHVVRLQPGTDLVPALIEAAKHAMSSDQTQSAFILSAVGSLKDVSLRLATISHNGKYDSCETKRLSENLEVVSLVGTLTPNGDKHLHLSVSDGKGQTYGGHLMEGVVFTTLELVLGTIANVVFDRELDGSTGYKELVVSQTTSTPKDPLVASQTTPTTPKDPPAQDPPAGFQQGR